MSASKPMRQAMPETAAFIDSVRKLASELCDENKKPLGERGVQMVNEAIRNGIAGGSDFYALENGQQIGSKTPVDRSNTACNCTTCHHWSRPGLSTGYCSGRPDLPPAYGENHPLRRLPADNGATCQHHKLQD